jgi:hypothetical protein
MTKKGLINQQFHFSSPQNWKVGLVSLQVLISFPIKVGESLNQRKTGTWGYIFQISFNLKRELVGHQFFFFLL